MNILEEKVRWFFKKQAKEMSLDDFELLKLGFFDDKGDVVFAKDVIIWRKINEVYNKKENKDPE